jgi:hypothetical protein
MIVKNLVVPLTLIVHEAPTKFPAVDICSIFAL